MFQECRMRQGRKPILADRAERERPGDLLRGAEDVVAVALFGLCEEVASKARSSEGRRKERRKNRVECQPHG